MNLFRITAIGFALLGLLIVSSICLKLFSTTPMIHYSEGERVGVLRKLSKKGVLYKTYEGELMLNAGLGSVKLDTFNFSLPLDSPIVDSLSNLIGQELKLNYNQYLVVPYRMGSTSYLVDSYELID